MKRVEADSMINDLLDYKYDDLIPTEIKFLESLNRWYGDLTEKQEDYLNVIWDKVMK